MGQQLHCSCGVFPLSISTYLLMGLKKLIIPTICQTAAALCFILNNSKMQPFLINTKVSRYSILHFLFPFITHIQIVDGGQEAEDKTRINPYKLYFIPT